MANSTSVQAENHAHFFWMPDPNFRGTSDIFSLCLSTLLISVWSVVHMDIPLERPGKVRSFIRNVLWMGGALFCPELLLFIAFNQKGNALAVLKDATEYLPAKTSYIRRGVLARLICGYGRQIQNQDSEASEKAPQPTRRHPFTLVHAFYASMGGYAFDLAADGSDHDPYLLPGGRTRMSITPAGLRFLMTHEPDLIPDLSRESITDRTQASSLGKALLLAQVAWFCANCVSRLAQGLPLSLLEISTVAHGLCTLVTYILWWEKPLNIAAPTFITGSRAREACALMTMCSGEERHMLYGVMRIRFPAEMSSLVILEDQTSDHVEDVPSPSSSASPTLDSKAAASATYLAHDTAAHAPTKVKLVPEQQVLPGTPFTPSRNAPPMLTFYTLKARAVYRDAPVPWYSRPGSPLQRVVLHQDDITRWTLAARALSRYGLASMPVTKLVPEHPYVTPVSSLQSSTDFKGHGLRGIARSNISAVFLGLIYGTPHFLGWNVSFPSTLERRLWRIATFGVSFWGVGMATTVALIVLVRWSLGIYTGERRGETRLVASLAALYILASGFLLVESVRQLFFLVPAAYQLPSWSNYWPHLS